MTRRPGVNTLLEKGGVHVNGFFNLQNIGFLVFLLILALLGIAFLSQPMIGGHDC